MLQLQLLIAHSYSYHQIRQRRLDIIEPGPVNQLQYDLFLLVPSYTRNLAIATIYENLIVCNDCIVQRWRLRRRAKEYMDY